MILLDTNIFIDHLRGYTPAVRFFESIFTQKEVIFSAITEAELIAGKSCNNREKKDLLLQFLYQWKKIPVSNQIAVLAGDLSREKEMNIADAIVAATAVINKAALLTKNVKDFMGIEGLSIKSPY